MCQGRTFFYDGGCPVALRIAKERSWLMHILFNFVLQINFHNNIFFNLILPSMSSRQALDHHLGSSLIQYHDLLYHHQPLLSFQISTFSFLRECFFHHLIHPVVGGRMTWSKTNLMIRDEEKSKDFISTAMTDSMTLLMIGSKLIGL